MWKHHVVYESRPRSVIVTLGGHLYKILEVVPTIVPPKQCRKVVSHITKFSFFTICSKGEHKDTATTTALTQAPSIHQKQVDKVATKQKDSFFTQSSHVSRLVKKVQPFKHQVLDNLPQAKQRNFSNFFPLSPRNSTQWRPLLPKEGGLIQMDIGGHPPIPQTHNKVFHLGSFLTVFRVPNF